MTQSSVLVITADVFRALDPIDQNLAKILERKGQVEIERDTNSSHEVGRFP